jgi:hypothetical protein
MSKSLTDGLREVIDPSGSTWVFMIIYYFGDLLCRRHRCLCFLDDLNITWSSITPSGSTTTTSIQYMTGHTLTRWISTYLPAKKSYLEVFQIRIRNENFGWMSIRLDSLVNVGQDLRFHSGSDGSWSKSALGTRVLVYHEKNIYAEPWVHCSGHRIVFHRLWEWLQNILFINISWFRWVLLRNNSKFPKIQSQCICCKTNFNFNENSTREYTYLHTVLDRNPILKVYSDENWGGLKVVSIDRPSFNIKPQIFNF